MSSLRDKIAPALSGIAAQSGANATAAATARDMGGPGRSGMSAIPVGDDEETPTSRRKAKKRVASVLESLGSSETMG